MLWYRVQLRNKPFCTMNSTGSGGNTNGNYPVSFSVLRELWCFAGRIGSSSLKTMEGDCLSCMKYLMFLFNFFIFVSIWNQLSVLHPRVSSSLLLPSRTHCNLVKLPEDALSFALAITKVFFYGSQRCSGIQQGSTAVTVVWVMSVLGKGNQWESCN